MTLFNYEAVHPTNVVEASASLEPDDITYAYLRIEATARQEVRVGDIKAIHITVPSSAQPTATALTGNPSNITPQARAFGHWTFARLGPANEFVAHAPSAGNTPPEDDGQPGLIARAGESITFFLYDIPIINHDGIATITVWEQWPPAADAEATETPPPDRFIPFVDAENRFIPFVDAENKMAVRKIMPSLRIDYFTAEAYRVTAARATNGITLAWATTGATSIDLSGITEPPGTAEAPPLVTKDGEIKVFPTTSTIYTLEASAANAERKATQQLLITITDQLETPKLLVGSPNSSTTINGGAVIATGSVTTGAITANTATGGSGSITANQITATAGDGSITARKITATTGEGSITANKLEIKNDDIKVNNLQGGIVPAGGIIMWHGEVVPEGWALCDGTQGTPDLSGRFIVGKGAPASNTGEEPNRYQLKQKGGRAKVTLTSGNVSNHSHSITRTASISSHSHDLPGADFASTFPPRDLEVVTDHSTKAETLEQTETIRLNASGSNTAHENRPPYYVLAFIMKLPVPSDQLPQDND